MSPIRAAHFCLVMFLVSALPASARAADGRAAAPPVARAAGEWPLERVTLADGKSYQGLVQAENESSIAFMEVRRPPGKPMSLVVRPIDRNTIARLERLQPAEQQSLRARLEKHKHRAVIEGRHMEGLPLVESRDGEVTRWTYEGPWFVLESTADEPMTRRVVVRLGQIFMAYGQLLPPRRTGERSVRIRLFGASDDYRKALAEERLQIGNPAVFLPDKNVILAGSDLNRFSADLAEVNREHRAVKARFEAQMADAPARLKQLGADLKEAAVPSAERLKILLAESKKWDDQRKNMRRRIAAIDRRNAARFDEVAGRMFKRLAHEAFHAYLETYVYPRQTHDVPRWLNEGLAQTFEAGLLEADSLRIDAPHVEALGRLQSDLRGRDPLPLSELLNAGAETFLSVHERSGESASRFYYYSWGLAYYLAFDQDVMASAELDAYLAPSAAAKPPVERFEELVGMPLSKFESRWRAAMLALKTAL
jgi:hypothetical protein